ncbi:MAG: zinc-ribbon domain containing protein [Clostridia bacterium]|nr:zinc-ribbon domain containing protein [Clostridia bacterium]
MPIKFECRTDNSFANDIIANIVLQNSRYQDRFLVCKECSGMFVWSAGEQDFFKKRNLHRPRRCKICRELKKNMRS